MADDLVSVFQNPQAQPNTQTEKNVRVVSDENDAGKHRIYFGSEKDDYFNVSGSREDADFLSGIVDCLAKSQKALGDIKSVSAEERPTLRSETLSDGSGAFFSPGDKSITMGKGCGNGFNAAGLFCHEFHHFKQDRVGEWMNVPTNLPDQMLVERMGEASAEVAKFQFFDDVRRLPEAKKDFESMMAKSPGFKDYMQAVDAGKSETDCVFAGMRGYASNHYAANFYAKRYHTMPFSLEKENKNLLDFNPSENDGIAQMMNEMQIESLFPTGQNVDETAYFKMVTVGLMSELPPDDKIKQEMRSDQFSYISASTYTLMKAAQDQCAACGAPHVDLGFGGRAVLSSHGLFRDGAAYEKAAASPERPSLQDKLKQMSDKPKPNLMQTLQSKTVQKDAAPKIPAKQAVRQGESR